MRFYVALLVVLMPWLSPAKTIIPKSIYDFKVKALNGGTIDFSEFKGKKILIVNTTALNYSNPQYAELEALSQKYKGKLVVIGCPIADFATPPGSRKDVSHLDPANYKVTFPLSSVVSVRGKEDKKAPVYQWLTEAKYNNYKDTEVKWDFQKYLINEKGELVAEFDPKVRVTNSRVISAIER